MPGSVSLSGKDVLCLNGRVLHDYASGDVAKLTFDADLVTVAAAKDGNIIYALNEQGKMASLGLKLLLGSSDDRYLNSLLANQNSDLSAFILIAGSFIKRVGDGTGKITNVVYNTLGGIVKRYPGASINTTGLVEQSIADWMLIFGNNTRAIM
jgi:hypothetical protein